jgi:hypothetical protein
MITRETTENPAPSNEPAILGTGTQEDIYLWVLALPLDHFITFYKASARLQEKLGDPGFWRMLFVKHYDLLPVENVHPKETLLSEYYYRKACEVYRQSRNHFFLQSSEAKIFLIEALSINPTHLLAAELLFFLYRDFCIQTIAPVYYTGMLEVGMVEAIELAKHMEYWFPLVGTWRSACFYRELAPYVARLGADYSDKIQRKLAEATTIFFHTASVIYPCDDQIDAVLAPLTGGYIYPQMGRAIVQEKLVKNNIYQTAVHNYYRRCVELFSILRAIEEGVKKISTEAIAVQVNASCTEIRYAINNFSQLRQNPEAIFTNISLLKSVLQEKFFSLYERQATVGVNHLVEQLNTYFTEGCHFRGDTYRYLELNVCNPNLPPNQLAALTGGTRTTASSAITVPTSARTSSWMPAESLTVNASASSTSFRNQAAPFAASASTAATSAQTQVMPFFANVTAITPPQIQAMPLAVSARTTTPAQTQVMPFAVSARTATPAQTQFMPFAVSAGTATPTQTQVMPFAVSARTITSAHTQVMPFAVTANNTAPTQVQVMPFAVSANNTTPTQAQVMPFAASTTATTPSPTNVMLLNSDNNAVMTSTQILVARSNPMGFLPTRTRVLCPTAHRPGNALDAITAITVPPGTTGAMPQLKL